MIHFWNKVIKYNKSWFFFAFNLGQKLSFFAYKWDRGGIYLSDSGLWFFFYHQDDGELYDEFGNLKKKFRAKTQQPEAARVLPGSGRAGWEVEDLGNVAYLELFAFKLVTEQAEAATLRTCQAQRFHPPFQFSHMFPNTFTLYFFE